MNTSAASEPLTGIGVVGGGLMGAGIAEICARAGQDVVVVESSDPSANAARGRLEKSLQRAEAKGKLAPGDGSAAEVLARIRVETDLDAMADRDVVVEAVVEDESVKVELFKRLDKIVVAPDAILASNTSSIPIMKLGVATTRPSQVIGIHFFNPVPILKLVELVPSLLTSVETTARSRDWVQSSLGKQAIDCQDRAGFVVNALLIRSSCRPSGCMSRGSPPPRTSTTGSCSERHTRKGPSHWPT